MSSPQEGIIFLHFLKIFESMSIHCLDTSPVIVIFNWDLYCTVSGLLTKTMFTTHDCFFNVKVLRNGKSNKSKECQCLVVNTENTFNGLKIYTWPKTVPELAFGTLGFGIEYLSILLLMYVLFCCFFFFYFGKWWWQHHHPG